MRLLRLLVLIILATVPVTAAAQVGISFVGPGARIRVWARDFGLAKDPALVKEVAGDTLVLAYDSVSVRRGRAVREQAVMRIPLTDIQRMELSGGQHANITGGLQKGVLIGGGIGLALGVVVAAQGCDPGEWICYGPEAVPLGALAGAFYGTLIGLIVGAIDRTETWQPVWLAPAAPATTLEVSPRPGGVGLGMSVRF